MINHQKVLAELIKAVESARGSCVRARKKVHAMMPGAQTSLVPNCRSGIQDAFRAHALANAAHNLAIKELREFHLEGKVPHRLEHIAIDVHQRVWGSLAPGQLVPA